MIVILIINLYGNFFWINLSLWFYVSSLLFTFYFLCNFLNTQKKFCRYLQSRKLLTCLIYHTFVIGVLRGTSNINTFIKIKSHCLFKLTKWDKTVQNNILIFKKNFEILGKLKNELLICLRHFLNSIYSFIRFLFIVKC